MANLERSINEALTRLASAEGDIKLSAVDDGRRLWLGVGYCVASGWAVYRGDDHYKITANGIVAHREREAERTG